MLLPRRSFAGPITIFVAGVALGPLGSTRLNRLRPQAQNEDPLFRNGRTIAISGFAQFLERWLDHVKSQVSPRTHERYCEIVRKNIVPALGAVFLTKLRPAQISAAYSNALTSGRRDGKGGLAPTTVVYMHRLIKQALGQAVRWELLARNPADAVDPPKVERRS